MFSSRAYEVNGTTLWVEDSGPQDAPVILCLHSLFLDGRMFAGFELEAVSRYRVVSPDFRGQGCSAPTVQRSIPMEQCAEDMLALISAMGLSDVNIIGASMGGDVAARMVVAKPNLFRSMVFMGSSVRSEPVEQALQFKKWLQSCAEIGFVGDNLQMLQAVMFGETTRRRDDFEQEFAIWLQKLSSTRKTLFPAMMGVLERGSFVDNLPKITVPTLVYSGEEDFARPPAWGRDIADSVSGARQIVLKGVGHSPLLEAPEIVIPGTLHFIDGFQTSE